MTPLSPAHKGQQDPACQMEQQIIDGNHVIQAKHHPAALSGAGKAQLKNAQKLNQIGLEIAAEVGVRYLCGDFKKKNGYKRSIELSAQYGLYRQGIVVKQGNQKISAQILQHIAGTGRAAAVQQQRRRFALPLQLFQQPIQLTLIINAVFHKQSAAPPSHLAGEQRSSVGTGNRPE